MYDPSIGRWLEEDPEGFAAGDSNLYRYVANSPTNATDPSGEARRLVRHTMPNGTMRLYQEQDWTPNSNLGGFVEGLVLPFGLGIMANRADNAGRETPYIGYIDPQISRTTVFRDDVPGSVELSVVENAVAAGTIGNNGQRWFRQQVTDPAAPFRDPNSATALERDYLRNLPPGSRREDQRSIGNEIPRDRGANVQEIINIANEAGQNSTRDMLVGAAIPILIAGRRISINIGVRESHIRFGALVRNEVRGGHHYNPNIPDSVERIRIVNIVRGSTAANRPYVAEIQIRTPSGWSEPVAKNMFPQNWTSEQVLRTSRLALQEALENGSAVVGRAQRFEGTANGLRIRGYVEWEGENTARITQAYPEVP